MEGRVLQVDPQALLNKHSDVGIFHMLLGESGAAARTWYAFPSIVAADMPEVHRSAGDCLGATEAVNGTPDGPASDPRDASCAEGEPLALSPRCMPALSS